MPIICYYDKPIAFKHARGNGAAQSVQPLAYIGFLNCSVYVGGICVKWKSEYDIGMNEKHS